MNSAAIKKKKVPLVGIPDRDQEKHLDDDIVALPLLIIKPIDHLKTLHEGSHEAAFAHVEIVAENGKRDYKQRRTDALDRWNKADSFDEVKDVFVAINPLYKSSREARRANANVSQINWLWVDIDCNDNSPDWAYVTAMRLEKIIGQQLPEPTMTVFSGRGLWLMWRIMPISPRNKISMTAWRKIMTQFGDVLRPFGADKTSTDPARLMRLAGSINSKSGKRVSIQRHNYKPYDIERLTEGYLPAVRKSKESKWSNKPNETREKVKKATGKKPRQLHTIRNLFYNRANDIETLVALRGGEMNGYRNKTLLIYAMNCLQLYKNLLAASQRVVEFNETFTDPLGASEVTAIMTSVENQERWWKNTTVIEWLDMTGKEQEQMVTIIDPEEKKARQRERMRKARGGVSKAEKDAERIIEQMEQIANLRKTIAANPSLSNIKLGAVLGWSESKIRRLKKLL